MSRQSRIGGDALSSFGPQALKIVSAIAFAAALSACAAGPSDLLSSGAPVDAASDTTKAKRAFNPFKEPEPAGARLRRVIAKPTLEQVIAPGPLEEISVGRADAPVTVIKYASPTCPFCRTWQRDVYPKFKRTYIDTGRVRFVVREFPIGFQSGAATIAIRCAPTSKRLALYSALLREQTSWVSQQVRRDPIFRIARRYGVTRTAFDACYDDKKLIADLKSVKDRGRTLGIIGTPNFFINERLEKRVLTMVDFRELIDPLLKTAGRNAQ